MKLSKEIGAEAKTQPCGLHSSQPHELSFFLKIKVQFKPLSASHINLSPNPIFSLTTQSRLLFLIASKSLIEIISARSLFFDFFSFHTQIQDG